MKNSSTVTLLTVMLGLCAPAAAGGQAVIELPAVDRPSAVRLEPVFTVGSFDGESWEQFQSLDHAAFTADGRLYLLDSRGRRLFEVGQDGALIREFGASGEGPGEMNGPRGLAALPGGGVAVWDAAKRAFLLYEANGQFRDELPVEFAAGLPDGPFLATEGDAVLSFPARITTGRMGHAYLTGSGTVPAAGGLPILRVRLAEPAVTERVAIARMPSGEHPTSALRAFEPLPSFGPLEGGRLAVHQDEGYRIEILGRKGTLERVLSRPLPVRPTRDSDRRAYLEARRERTVRRLGPGAGPPATGQRAPDPWFYPRLGPVRRITADGGSRIWVERRDPSDPTRPGAVDLLRADGSYLGTLDTRGQGVPDAFGPGGLVVFLERAEFDVPVARVWRVRPASDR